MRIALFSDTSLNQINGVAVNLLKMKDYMDRKGIQYRFFVPGASSDRNVLGSIINSRSFNFLLYPECRIALPRYDVIKKELDRFRPDIIHLVNEFSMGLAGLKYGLGNHLPLVGSFHTNIPGYLRYYRAGFLENTAWRYMRWFHGHCLVNFCPSIDTMEELDKRGFINPEVLENGIDTDRFSPVWRDRGVLEKYGIAESTVLLYVGRVAPEKDLDLLLDAMELLNRSGVDCRLLVVGDGPSRKKLEARNVDNVVFAGYLTGEELLTVFASADIFAFPSRTETFGNVVLEAMSSGLPVAAVYGGGVRDHLLHLQNGIACEPGDCRAMADALQRLVEDPGLRETLGRNAREYALTKSWNRVFDELFESYRAITEEWYGVDNRMTA
ncbi:MAG: glycosyltransferase family 1 protein [Firmicutes bacterium]|nr:glycosyltransferase family 1 protein [Bacillota bacterium]